MEFFSLLLILWDGDGESVHRSMSLSFRIIVAAVVWTGCQNEEEEEVSTTLALNDDHYHRAHQTRFKPLANDNELHLMAEWWLSEEDTNHTFFKKVTCRLSSRVTSCPM